MEEAYANGSAKSLVVDGGDIVVKSGANVSIESGGYFFGDGQKLSNIDAAKIVNITGPLPSNVLPEGIQSSILEENMDSNQIEILGDLYVHSNLRVQDDMYINGQKFPMPDGSNDRSKVLATNSNGDFELVTVFSDNVLSEFKSLYGVTRTGVRMEEISGIFDFGVTRYWLEGWPGKVFDCSLDSLAPSSDGSSIIPSTLVEVDTVIASNNLHYVNISLVTESGAFLSSNCGIATGIPSDPNYFYFLGVLDPNTNLFRNKFTLDFEHFYNNRYLGSDPQNTLGYQVNVDYVSMPHEKLHSDGTKFYTVEFMNMYNVSMYEIDSSLTTRYKSYATPADRRHRYYQYNPELATYQAKDNVDYGLFPHITYKKWKNMESSNDMRFYDRIYTPYLGWASNDGYVPDVDTVFAKFSSYEPLGNIDWLYELWLKTYAYIFNGEPSSVIQNYDEATFRTEYDSKVTNVVGHNIILASNINEHLRPNGSNNLMISANYSIVYSKDAFPTTAL